MAVPQGRKLKIITFTLGGTQFQCQLQKWNLANNTADGERFYTFCAGDATGEFREDAEPDYALELTFFADWRSGGISDFLVANDQLTAAFVLDHHPDIPGEHVQYSGNCKCKAPAKVGGEARKTEMTECTLPVYGKPAYARL